MTMSDQSATDPADSDQAALDQTATQLDEEATQKGLSEAQYKKKMERRKAVQEQRLAERKIEKGLIIVNTGNGKGKTTAALGVVLRSLGHGFNVAIVQFIKGGWEPAEKAALSHWPEQLKFHAMGEGFTWETQDRDRDIKTAGAAWEKALTYIRDADYRRHPGVRRAGVCDGRHGRLAGLEGVDGLARQAARPLEAAPTPDPPQPQPRRRHDHRQRRGDRNGVGGSGRAERFGSVRRPPPPVAPRP